MQKTLPSVLILGIGNLLWADEGFGVRVVESMHRYWQFSDNVKLMDGGTQGIYLVQHIRETDILVVFDAVDYGLPAGSMKFVTGDEVPHFLGAKKMSLHQTGFQEVLAMAEMMGDYPEHIALVGVQPVELEDFGGSLRPEVKAQVQPAIEKALAYLSSLGIEARARTVPLDECTSLSGEALALHAYETGRPDDEQACRMGDERLLNRAWSGPADFDAEMEAILKAGGRD